MEEIVFLIIDIIKDYFKSQGFKDDIKYIFRKLFCNLIADSISNSIKELKNHSNANKSGSDDK